MKAIAKAGLAYLWRFSLFIFLAIVTNIALAITYFGNITALFHGEHIVVGVITLLTIIVFPIIWFISAQQEAIYASIHKVLSQSSGDVVEFIVDKFVDENNKDRVGDYMGVLNRQSKLTQIILGFIFEKIDFFGEISNLLKEKNYSNSELKLKMVEKIEEKELFEAWEPTLWIPFLLLISNIGVVVLANKFLI